MWASSNRSPSETKANSTSTAMARKKPIAADTLKRSSSKNVYERMLPPPPRVNPLNQKIFKELLARRRCGPGFRLFAFIYKGFGRVARMRRGRGGRRVRGAVGGIYAG